MIKKVLLKYLNSEYAGLYSVIKGAIIIIIVSALIGFTVNLFNPNGFVLAGKTAEKNKNIVFISSEEAKIKKECSSAIFIDAREEEEFKISHIPGAINIPAVPEEFAENKMKENPELFTGSKELVLYCDGITCGSSELLAKLILKKEYPGHIYIIKNGIPEWAGKGFPVDK